MITRLLQILVTFFQEVPDKLKVKYLYISLTFLFFNHHTLSQEQIVEDWQKIENQIKNSGAPPLAECDKSPLPQIKVTNSIEHYFTTPIGKTQVSAISIEDLNKVFNFIKNSPDIEFNYVFAGCEARAHKMSKILDSLGIISAKAFLHSEQRDEKLLRFNKNNRDIFWESHVAPIIKVTTGKKVTKKMKSGWFGTKEVIVEETINMVIDPSVSDRPLKLEEWKETLTNNKEKTQSFITSRFNFFTADKYESRNSYAEMNEFHMLSGLDLGHQCISDMKNNIYNEKCDYSHLNNK